MKILSMTATFGKLSGDTLTLQPGLNIIEAPNEWGKSTWCAFLVAMLYGIDTGSRSKTGFLAEKEHYAPWSGEPMSGSLNIAWNGRNITIERKNKGRTPMGDVKAYETDTGIAVPELSVSAPGEVLLGVERNVFARAGFLRLAEMPVTEDEALRRRLNELVTTADESGASDDLAQKLKDLKNRCRFNKKGLIPELEAKVSGLNQKLQQIDALRYQITSIAQRQTDLSEQSKLLENHRQTLAYQENLSYFSRLEAARETLAASKEELARANAACEGLPSREQLRSRLVELRSLRDTRDALLMQAQMMPEAPQMPAAPEVFRAVEPHRAVEEAQQDVNRLSELKKASKKPTLFLLGIALALLSVPLLLSTELWIKLCGALAVLAGVAVLFGGIGRRKKQNGQIAELTQKYRNIPEDTWVSAASAYAAAQASYDKNLAAHQQELANIRHQMDVNRQAMDELTGGQSIAAFDARCREMEDTYRRWEEQQRRYRQAAEVYDALKGSQKEIQPPTESDTLTYSLQETLKHLSDNQTEQKLLQQRLGQCQGQMQALGQKETLEEEKQAAENRIAALEQHYTALTLAQDTLQQASQELQRRFAPRLSQRAQVLFSQLTGGRYQKLSLSRDLSVEALAQGETTLRGTLWRSDGTVDQLYLALRLAVAEELTPDAPLILDDALVRFDDVRLKAALNILRQTGKQVILFTCQSRETTLYQEENQ